MALANPRQARVDRPPIAQRILCGQQERVPIRITDIDVADRAVERACADVLVFKPEAAVALFRVRDRRERQGNQQQSQEHAGEARHLVQARDLSVL